jgi:ribosomal protein S18 acetylase RimI-like enzyme
MQRDYVKRVRMQRSLSGWLPSLSSPLGLYWQPWNDAFLDMHASVKFLSFANSIDAQLFPNLAGLTGCRLLMHAIRDSEGFCPQATWLLMNEDGAVGTIQGILEGHYGSIQNIGVLPGFRRQGFGAMLVAKALHGFRAAGAMTVSLEVTANNPNAARLYRRLGFKSYNSYVRERPRTVAALTGAGL